MTLQHLYITPTFLSKEETNYFIDFHKQEGRSLAKDFYGNKIIPVIPLLQDDVLRFVFTRICAHIQAIDNNLFPNNMEIVKWHEDKHQEAHVDFEYHPYTSIIYLNDDYEGGETFIDQRTIKPERGKMITFQGADMLHGVKKIIKGTRYTIPIWYKNISNVN